LYNLNTLSDVQINFDLLGELIKFNKTLFKELNRFLAGDRFDQFVEVLVTNLVDSNVFVRSLVLSLDSFKRSRQNGVPASSSSLLCSSHHQASSMSSDTYKLGNTPSSRSKEDSDDFCMITAFVSQNTLRLLRDLMCAVRLSDINQVTQNSPKNLTQIPA
jgi:Trpc4-associated protein